jgi:hypothetical protein
VTAPVKHNHLTRDIKKRGAGCDACDAYHEGAIRTEIAILEQRQERFRSDLKRIEQLLKSAREDLAQIHVGDSVVWSCDKKEYKVVRIEPKSWGGKPWVNGVTKKKNGEWGTGERHLSSDWERVEQ